MVLMSRKFSPLKCIILFQELVFNMRRLKIFPSMMNKVEE